MEDIRETLEVKYADVINDLQTKYGGTDDKGFEYFIAMLRAWYLNEEPLYVTDLEINKEEALEDYKEYLGLAEEKAANTGLI